MIRFAGRIRNIDKFSKQLIFNNFFHNSLTIFTIRAAATSRNKVLNENDSLNIKSVKIENNEAIQTRYRFKDIQQYVKPYVQLMRIDKPIGASLLFWPCGWSIALSAPAGMLPDYGMLILFGFGAVLMRGAGCTINDMWDKNIDGKVERTKDRPLVTGKVSQMDAWVFLSAQLGVSCLILLQLNWYSIVLGASSLGLVVIYPLMKRFTYWPQFILGMTFNWGALLGWSAIHGDIQWSACLPLYLSGVFWTLIYDTIYAHQDKKDDLTIGMKSTALKFGKNTKLWLAGFSIPMLSCLMVTGSVCDLSWPYYCATTLIFSHLGHQIYSLNIDNPNDCAKKFISNQQIGFILFIGIVLGTYFKKSSADQTNNIIITSNSNHTILPINKLLENDNTLNV